jgi:2-polyprenyl-3-methyl-5-hydroxy-6-metoxy-1,4-benzoquinol methylase
MENKSNLRYSIKDGPYSSHSQIIRIVEGYSTGQLLDVGCAQGELAKNFVDLGWNVFAIEPDSADAFSASDLGIKVVNSTVEEALPNLRNDFDCIVIADVLEHLLHPLDVLIQLSKKLAPGGKIVASVPNIANFTIRISLLFGLFNYTDRGILDRTHLHFYTRKTLKHLFTDANLKLEKILITPIPIERIAPAWILSNRLHFLHKLIFFMTKLWARGFGYQFIIVASKKVKSC